MYQLNNDDDPSWGDSKYPIQHIYVEQPFTFFNSGGSSAKTMATLQRFNGIVSWLLYEIFEIPNISFPFFFRCLRLYIICT